MATQALLQTLVALPPSSDVGGAMGTGRYAATGDRHANGTAPACTGPAPTFCVASVSSQFGVRVEHQALTTWVLVAGDIDLSTARLLTDRLTAEIDGVITGLVVELTDVDFMGAAGLTALIEARAVARDGGCVLQVTGCRPAVRRTIDICGLAETFAMGAIPR
ncbi:MAG: STAS domain-containing protein [Acidimicrobiia bacterium]